jgi:small subunit ribosomal protein S17e
VDRIKRLSYEVLEEHKSKFGVDFADNKKVLNQISIIRSKGLKNEIAGYITKFIKKEIREEKTKQDRIDASRTTTEPEQEIETSEVPTEEIPETAISTEEILSETTENTPDSETSETTENTPDSETSETTEETTE